MSVLKSKRKQSKLEVYNHAVKMRKDLTMLLLRDLGTKRTVRNMRIRTDGMEPQDADLLLGITEKYNLTKFPGDYPEWLIEKLRDSIWNYLRDMMTNITRAYSIWAKNKAEADERRICQDRAIGCCESILKEMELAIEVLPVDVEKYMPYVESITKEIALLKGWRKNDNKRFSELKE